MNSELEKILLENLKQSLIQYQNYLIGGLVAAILFFLLSRSTAPTAKLSVGIGSIEANIKHALYFSFCLYWISGALASYALENANRIGLKLQHNEPLLKAAITYPSLATEIHPGIRVIAGILPALIMVYSFLTVKGTTSLEKIFMLIIIAAPYLTITIELVQTLSPLNQH
jgi:hypothetical protein